jgi:uncharacterized protein YjbJ (UPF0337 family)
MTDRETTERTASGPVGRLAGKAKAAAGSALGNEELAREGRLQQAQSDAELAASREQEGARLQQAAADVDAEKAEIARARTPRDRARGERTAGRDLARPAAR